MRTAFALTVCLLLAGCFASEEPATETPEGAPTGSEGAKGPPEEPTAPASDEPAREPIEIRHDYGGAAESVEFEVVEGSYDVRIRWYAPPTVMGCVSADARATLIAPTGDVFAEAAAGNVMTPCDGNANSKRLQDHLEGGVWKADFTGSGAAVAVITLDPI